MQKIFFSILAACLLLTLFTACQGEEEYGNADQCVMGVQFEVISVSETCPEGEASFDLFFIDQDGNQYVFPYVLPADAGVSHIIGLPAGNTYGGWVKGDGGLALGCAEPSPFVFKVKVINPDDGELCAEIITSVDGRPDVIVVSDPLVSFTLPDKCDGCPDIEIADPPCSLSNCGGTYDGFYPDLGYYTYPLEQLSLCPNLCVKISGDPFGVPNQFTILGNGLSIDSKWVGDGVTYTQGPWSGTTIPLTYTYILETEPDVDYSLLVSTVNPRGSTDTWTAYVTCESCD